MEGSIVAELPRGTARGHEPSAGRRKRHEPEGPFESGDMSRLPKGSPARSSRFSSISLRPSGDEADQVLSLKRGYDETRLITTLLRNHLEGKQTTTSALANASGSGLRDGDPSDCIRSRSAGLYRCAARERKTGKSFSLHPIRQAYCTEWQEYARRVRRGHRERRLASTRGSCQKSGIRDYFFGASYSDSPTRFPPPTPLAIETQPPEVNCVFSSTPIRHSWP